MSWYKTHKETLAGLVLRSVSLDKGRDELRIETDTGRVIVFTVSGECCSRSWIEHLESPGDIVGATVLDVIEASGDTRPGEDLTQFDVLQVYETRIRTDRGDIVLEYRNDSNGYYGGSLDLQSDTEANR
jgi:hypothetical protein